MKHEILEASYRIETAKSLDRAWAEFLRILELLHLNKVIYITKLDSDQPDWFVLSNLPRAWPLDETKRPDFSEPFLSYCCATFEPTKIGAGYLALHNAYVDDYTRDYVGHMQSFDWEVGLGIPCALKGNGRFGGVLVGNALSVADFERAVMPFVDQIRLLCQIAHQAFERWRFGQRTGPVSLPLSAREHQVFELLSEGRRPKEVALALNLSEASVRLYTKNARLKLGAKTTAQAIALYVSD